MENSFFYDTRINNNLLAEKMPKKIRHPKNPKGRLVGPDKANPTMAEFQSPISYCLHHSQKNIVSNYWNVSNFPIGELVNFSIEPIKSKMPFQVKFDFVFILDGYQSFLSGDGFKNAIVQTCENLNQCAIDAKFKCKSNEAKIDLLLGERVGHIAPIKFQGRNIGYAVTLLGLEVELCVSKKDTKKLTKLPQTQKIKPNMFIVSEEEILNKIAI